MGITGSSRQDQRGRVATFILKEEGEYNLVLTVTNSGGRYETWSHKFIIRPAHRANIQRLTISDQSGVYPLTTAANFTASHPNSHLVGAERLKLKCEISWGDGPGVSAADVLPGQPVRDEHTYTRPGRYPQLFACSVLSCQGKRSYKRREPWT